MSLRFLLPACLVLACLPSELGGMATAWAQQATTPSALTVPELTPAEAQRALSVLQDPAQRARLIETLQTIAKAAGPVPAEAASVLTSSTGVYRRRSSPFDYKRKCSEIVH